MIQKTLMSIDDYRNAPLGTVVIDPGGFASQKLEERIHLVDSI